MKPFLLLASAACLSGMAASPKAEAQNMPFRSSLHDAALREALGDSVLSLAQTAGTAEAASPWSQWHVRHVRLSALEWGKKVLWHDAAGRRSSQGAYYRDGTLKPFTGDTGIFIYPGYRFRVVDALVTNFHLPESTLLMLVSAFAGYSQVMAAYQEAIREQYRFFSYGDAMWMTRNPRACEEIPA